MARVLVCLSFLSLLSAQERVSLTPRARPPVSASRAASLRYDVRLVQIPVVVTDPRGKPVIDLPRESFRLFEDDVEHEISAFAVNDAPVSVTVVFDTSRSMKPRIADARTALDQFMKTSLPGDEFSLIRFSDRAEILSPFIADQDQISSLLSGVEPKGWTALFDALCLGAHQSRKAHNQRRIMLVLSDGGDNNSRYSLGELVSLLREADVEVYAIGIGEKPRVLEKLADETGGRAMWVRKLDDLPDAMDTLSRLIRSEYVIGYSPNTVVNDGKYHRIRVDVQPPAGAPRIRATWRRGYTAPGD